MSQHYWNALVLIAGSVLGTLGFAQSTMAQVISDDTLPAGERSQVSGDPNFQIDGGAQRGGNLFHSFSQFSVPAGGSVYFNNAADVQIIFSRVTGSSVSNIDGLIQANGNADLFLLNPNGILFGPNGSLDIGGSFVATTANRINFADGFQYSATSPQTTPLLTISAPVGLQMGASPGQIEVQGNGYDLSVSDPIFTPLIRGNGAAGLAVPAGQTLALIGGDIILDGGSLTAEQGQIELGSVRDGLVTLNPTAAGFSFDYSGSQGFGDIRLSQQALADASGGGLIQVQGNNVSLTDGSLLLIQNQENQAGGSIRVNAGQSLELSGDSPDGSFAGGLESQTVGSGQGAEITVSTQQLIVQSGAGISTFSFGSGTTGNITISAADSVQLTGVSPTNPILPSNLSTASFSTGDMGSITLLTDQLMLLDGGSIASTNFATGQGGDVTVDATKSVEVIGQSASFLPSNISASTYGFGGAGEVTINTTRLVIRDGGVVATSTLAIGDAGSLTINARESVELSGTVPGSVNPSFLGSSATFLNASLQQVLAPSLELQGNSGDVTVNTEQLSIGDTAKIDVSNLGTGNAGQLRVNANSIVIDRGGTITAATASGEGGNIDLNVQDFLLLRNNSQITTSAGGNGGNILISAGSIIAVPGENSDISANSVNARGGNVTINASGIFGIQFRPQGTPLSDITASGVNSAASGTVQLNINQLDPTFGLAALPTNLIDPSRLIAQGCPANQGNSFVVTGRGGLPPNPEQQLDDDAAWQDRRRLGVGRSALAPDPSDPAARFSRSDRQSSTPPLIEATALQIAPDGTVRLVAPAAVAHDPPSLSVACQGGE